MDPDLLPRVLAHPVWPWTSDHSCGTNTTLPGKVGSQGITRCFVLNLSALETQEWRLTPLIWFGHLASLATWLEVLAQVSSSKNTSEKTGQNWSSYGSQFVLQG